MKSIVLALALSAAVPSALAAGPSSVGPYRSSLVIGVEDARLGEVLMAREIQLEPSRKANVGSVVGAAVGYGAARQVKGDYRNAARVAGGVIGGVAGTAIQNAVSHRKAYEVSVRELTGKGDRVVVLIHEGDLGFREGDRVFLVGKGNKTRLVLTPREGIECFTACGTTQMGSTSGREAQ
ncbi:glycine zipper 2TM domain-containing protein [Pseudoxanthomonas sp. OG2]|uniref:glycine zipper 2TM domain-containing protein n=1 Tax=Pseudoxanthomonas sp. OG2 TaxID=2587011 RepID=UPI00161A435D|nr:glycine zipper 2TM domain-containing protein [Pseudoxanthomonas sp. OG2]MBB3277372.1 outer membrane lipoprotein SlyB [Pseudoxanthomonas sp. OG2]